jgi:hypothetical protein
MTVLAGRSSTGASTRWPRRRRCGRPAEAAVKGFRLGDSRRSTPRSWPKKGETCAATDGPRPASAGHHHAALHEARRRLGPHRGRGHQGHLHGQRRGAGAALPQGQGRGLDHRRSTACCRAPPHPLAARGHKGQPPAAPTRSSASSAARCARWSTMAPGRAHAVDRLRRDPGRRRHAHRLHHRRLRGLVDALRHMQASSGSFASCRCSTSWPRPRWASSGQILLDLNYEEDSKATWT